jgi:hypothetical protein
MDVANQFFVKESNKGGLFVACPECARIMFGPKFATQLQTPTRENIAFLREMAQPHRPPYGTSCMRCYRFLLLDLEPDYPNLRTDER